MPKKAPPKGAPKRRPPPRQPPRHEHFHPKPAAPSAEEARTPSEHERHHWRSKISEKPAEKPKPPIVQDIGGLQQEYEKLRAKCDGLETKLEAETQLRKEGEQKMEIARRRCAASNQTNMQAVGMMRQKNADFAKKIRKMNNDRDLSKKASDAAIAQAEGEAKRFQARVDELGEDNETLQTALGLCEEENTRLRAAIHEMGALGDKARAVGRPSSPPPVGSAVSRKTKKKKRTRRRRRRK